MTTSLAALSTGPVAPVPESSGRRLRVLHLHSGNMYGGVETLLLALASMQGLCPSMEQRFGLCFEGRLSAELSSAQSSPYMLGPVRISRPWTMWRARRRLRQLLERERFDAIICHMPWPLVVFGSALRRPGSKLVFWAHNFHTGTGWLERLAKVQKPDAAISTSRSVGATVSKIFPGISSAVLYCPLRLIESSDGEQWRAEIRRELGVDASTVVDVQISRFESWKGHLLHLRALAELKDVPNWTAWFVGGPHTPDEHKNFRALEEAAREFGIDGRVRFLGQRSDVPKLLAAADFLCQPNTGPEPFGIAFVEALWAGRPVVTSALGGALEILNDSCGVLVEPAVEPLAAALRQVIASPELRSRLGKAGPARARELCAPDSQIPALARLVEQFLTAAG